MADDDLDGDHATLLAHLRKISFCVGVEEGRWQVMSLAFPYLLVRVTGRGLAGTAVCMDFRLECRGFPVIGPFVEHWDVAQGQRAAPLDGNAVAPSVADAFKQWNEHGTGYGGIYRPWQRGAAGHNNWAQLRPDLAWNSRREVTFIMEQLYGLVSEQAYWLDCRAAA